MSNALSEENTRLKQWVSDLQASCYVNCVYCGHRYGPDDEVPVAMAEALRQHIAQCPEHPLSKEKAALKATTDAYEWLREEMDRLRDDSKRLSRTMGLAYTTRADEWEIFAEDIQHVLDSPLGSVEGRSR